MGMNTGTGSYRLYTSRSYGNRRRGLTGNQLKVLGIVAILIDNVGAVLIQGGILHAADRTLYQAMIATRSGHIWMIAGICPDQGAGKVCPAYAALRCGFGSPL